jgi:hypothetical protein
MRTLEKWIPRDAMVSIQSEETVNKHLMFEVEDQAIDFHEAAAQEEHASQRQEDLDENEFARFQQLIDEPVLLRPDEAFIARMAKPERTSKKTNSGSVFWTSDRENVIWCTREVFFRCSFRRYIRLRSLIPILR